MELTIEQALREGVAAQKAGELRKAEQLYGAILQAQPAHTEANYYLGMLAVSLGKTEEALPFLKAALESDSSIEQLWLSFIEALIGVKRFDNARDVIQKGKKQGLSSEKLASYEAQLADMLADSTQGFPPQRQLETLLHYYQTECFSDAEKLALSLTQQFPRHPFAWKVLGSLCAQAGRLSESLAANQKSVELAPRDAEAHNSTGSTLHHMGRFDEAEASYRQSIAIKPDYVQAYNNLGATLQAAGRLQEAESSYKRAIVLNPDKAEVHYNLAVILQELGRLDEAESSLRRAIGLRSDYAEAFNSLGNTLQEQLRSVEAEDSYRQAIALRSGYVEAFNNLGNALLSQGRVKEAEDSYRQAIALKGDHAKAHRHLASIKKFDAEDEQYLAMQALYLDDTLSKEQRCHLSFGLAKACEDIERYEQAYQYYEEGNTLRKELLNYDIEKDVDLFNQIKAAYPLLAKNSLKHGIQEDRPVPVFIVGMPRSGTTLVEQIISCHSNVTGAGELIHVGQFGKSIASGLSPVSTDALFGFRNRYLTELENRSSGNPVVIDKMPQNFRYIGLLAAAFPEAKIVHVKRNSAAVCWANYKQYFASKDLGYCYAIDDVVKYYSLYQDLMTFWASCLSSRIYDVDYERLTVSQEAETRQLIYHLGLDWEEECLSPHLNRRSVATASTTQVRKEVYQGSSQRWKAYKPFLAGAFDHLED